MSFTDTVKHEIIRKDNQKQLNIAQISAVFRMKEAVSLTRAGLAARVRFFHGDLARKMYIQLKNIFNLNAEITVSRRHHFSTNHIYEIVLPPEPENREFFNKIGFTVVRDELRYKLSGDFYQDKEARKYYLRGAFLAVGSVNQPSSEYHLEFRTRTSAQQNEIKSFLMLFDLNPHLTHHKGNYVLYFKKFSEITTILNIIGAHQALLKLEDTQILRNVKNDVNRKVNCETANLDKTVKAAMEQLDYIELIEKKKGLDSLSESLQEIAALRREHPYASLKELGQKLNPTLSKSGVNHRLRRIKKIAGELQEGD